MKYFFLFLSLFISIISNAQDFQPLENSPYQDVIFDLKELDNGHFIYIQTYYFPEDEVGLAEVLVATDSIYSVVKLVDENFELLSEFPIKTTNYEETLMGWDILPTDNGYIISGTAFSPFTSFRKNFILQIDEDFNEIGMKIFAHAFNIFWMDSPIINYDDNLVFIGGYDGVPTSSAFLVEYSLDGDLLNLATFSTFYADDFVQLPDSSYRVYSRILSRIRDLPADWSGFSEEILLNPENAFINNNSSILLDDGRWILSGVSPHRDPVTFENTYFSQLVSIQPDTTFNIIYESPSPDSTSGGRGFRAMDMIDTSCIYFSNFYRPCYALDNPMDSCHNIISIHNVHINGTENWTQYLGFDASYYPTKVLATQDEGVIILVYRYNEEENLEGEGDMYFIKFDKEGNVDFITSTGGEIPTITLQQILVYPNPARDVLQFVYSDTQMNAPFIRLFDSVGRLVLEDQILDKKTDISRLVSGNYFYEIIDQQRPVQTGSVIKQ